jgi:intracellular multiplication protein IcmT
MAARPTAFWRDSARNPRFFMVDALTALPLVLFLLHIRKWTFILAILTTIFFGVLERFNFTLPVFIRWARSSFAGRVKIAKPNWRQ